MKTAATLSLAFALALFVPLAVQADQGTPSPEAPVVEIAEAPAAEAESVQPFAAESALTLDAASCPTNLIGPGPLPYCGDYCYEPGRVRGCLDQSGGGGPERTLCICQNGAWLCGTF